jgi:hypothetical protein
VQCRGNASEWVLSTSYMSGTELGAPQTASVMLAITDQEQVLSLPQFTDEEPGHGEVKTPGHRESKR